MEIIAMNRFKGTLKYIRLLILITIIAAVLLTLFVIGLIGFAKWKGAPPLAVPQSTIFYAEDGTKIGENHHGGKRYWVPLEDISPYAIQATLSIEDRKFFEHHGFDFKRIMAAIIADIKAMAKVQGASTITQQYARNLFLSYEKTWFRKWNEAIYTIRLEANYSKEQILEGYLNTIYYGHGVYGIEAAANYYFGKSAKELSLAEAAMLAGIPKGPSYYSPLVDEQRAKERQKIVLRSMVENGAISEKEAKEAEKVRLHYSKGQGMLTQSIAPYFQDIVKTILRTKLGLDEETIEMGGLRVYTSLDVDMQAIAEKQIETIISKQSDIQAALVAMEPKTGEVKALVGGRDYTKSPFNRAVQAERQPGSTFKPFLYYAALKHGFTPSTELRSELTTFTLEDGTTYTPHNFNNYYANDTITLAQAIALSDNVFAVKTHLLIGQEELVQTAKQLGITSKLKAVPSLALGTSPVKVIDMVQAYSTIANNGKKIEPVFIKKIVNYEGKVIYEHKPAHEQILDPNLAFVTTHLMTGMFDPALNDYSTVTGQSIISEITRPYAGKSGTTKTDSWMIGYTPQLVAGVWTGYDRDQTIDKMEEKQYAKKIWVRFMEESLEGKKVKSFEPTDGVVGVYVDPHNGKLATDSCPTKRFSYYIAGTEPTESCTDHFHEKKKKKKKPKEKDSWLKHLFDWF
ncbi:transglycosylase domain-containing protein [Thermolongibacillus altinsuensis]|uniref:transglycosylase domain-containing protein n=1 Tax=Thermolongibacillus altinsuensis TaxID=575256 RepID=UPI00242A2E3E|nr:transglycosylase domain-containing protein [Thermolongibacillus altinsuensis]GMB09469.1 penicillin-binding protein [Thermolongibacillus altinsuensis]